LHILGRLFNRPVAGCATMRAGGCYPGPAAFAKFDDPAFRLCVLHFDPVRFYFQTRRLRWPSSGRGRICTTVASCVYSRTAQNRRGGVECDRQQQIQQTGRPPCRSHTERFPVDSETPDGPPASVHHSPVGLMSAAGQVVGRFPYVCGPGS